MSPAEQPITFSPGTEDWFEYGPREARRRVAFHDYAAIYDEPGLYERVFCQTLGMCSARVVPELYLDALLSLGGDAAQQTVLELGAGNGMAGEHLRDLGVGRLVGIDLEPAAARAAARDRPGVYDEYLTGDISRSGSLQPKLHGRGFDAMLAVAAVAADHMPPRVLETAMELVRPGGLVAFAVTPALTGDSTDPVGLASGFPSLLAERVDPWLMRRRDYVHRRQTDGTPHHAVALVARRPFD